jgi:negative regulator of sigma E activity
MRPELPAILRSYAADLAVCWAQYSAMADVMREAADALLTAPLKFTQRIDHLPVIASRCPACEDE